LEPLFGIRVLLGWPDEITRQTKRLPGGLFRFHYGEVAMRDITAGRPADADTELHEYHSAVEVDENYDNWRDWVGPVLAILAVVGALVLLFLTSGGHI
jgi:hypothetical protein